MDPDAGNPPTYYVDVAAGSDMNPGTLAFPWRTAARVNGLDASVLPPGSTVRFAGGQTWNERLVPPTSGDAGQVISFGTYGAGVATFDGMGNTTTGLDVRNRAYLSFANLRVRNFPGSFCAYLEAVDHLSFTDIELETCSEGFHASPGSACDDITVTRLNAHDFSPLADGGGASNFAFNLPTSCDRWAVTDSTIARCQRSCVNDLSTASTWLRLTAAECGTSASAGTARAAMMLRGNNTTVQYGRFDNAGTSCIDVGAAGGSVIEASVISRCSSSGIVISAGATGTARIRRNTIFDVDRGISVLGGSGAANISNNTVLGGQSDGGMTAWAFGVRPGPSVALENNLSTGTMTHALSVVGLDAGPLGDGGFEGAAGYVERANWFDLSMGQALQWDVNEPPAQYLLISGQGAGTSFTTPMLASTTITAPNFTPGNVVRDTGVPNPATGVLTVGCDAGITTYCGAAPEPGSVELIP